MSKSNIKVGQMNKGHIITWDNKKSNPKFQKGDLIMWNSIYWLVDDVSPGMYELKLAYSTQFTTTHGNGGYMDSNEIDKNATLVETGKKIGGWKRSRKNRRSKNRRHNSAKRQ
jgi:hypothetical protein